MTARSFDLEPLLEPVSADAPAGEWLRTGEVYVELREARRADDPTLERGVWQRDLKRADWRRAEQLAGEGLERSKDLQLAAWLLEAWLHRHGFAGLAPGLRLLEQLCRRFWDVGLYPPLDDDGDPEYRLAPVRWVDEKLFLALKLVPVTAAAAAAGAGEGRPLTWADWESAARMARLAEMDAAKAKDAEGRLTREAFLAEVASTPTDFYRRLAADLAAGREALGSLAQHLDERAGQEAPSFHQMRDTLEDLDRFAAGTLRERGEEEPEAPEEPEESGEAGESGEAWGDAPGRTEGDPDMSRDPVPEASAGPITSRVEAYRRLAEAADYLLRTEPHSPTPYLVRRAVSWGGMTLAQVLAELHKHGGDLGTVYRLLGIEPDAAP
jgi:type VI secretion system protein ImpA